MAKKKADCSTTKAPSKRGRPYAYTPEELSETFDSYKDWLKSNPRRSYMMTKMGQREVKIDRPMTLIGFCQFAEISLETFSNYERKSDLFGVQCARVREAIEADQLEGAMVGQYAQSIVARVLKLADRTEVVNKSEVERIAEMTDGELQTEIDKLSAMRL